MCLIAAKVEYLLTCYWIQSSERCRELPRNCFVPLVPVWQYINSERATELNDWPDFLIFAKRGSVQFDVVPELLKTSWVSFLFINHAWGRGDKTKVSEGPPTKALSLLLEHWSVFSLMPAFLYFISGRRVAAWCKADTVNWQIALLLSKCWRNCHRRWLSNLISRLFWTFSQ